MPASAAKKAKPAARKAPAKKLTLAASDKMIGKLVPDFDLPATKTGNVSRTGLKGKPYVIYFYPKDDTSGCTAEACDFRDNIVSFKKFGITVIGVSKDSLQRHEKFSAKYDLNFPLASDEKTKMCEAFGVYVEKSMYGRKYMGIERSTFLVDGKGIIRAAWRKVSVTGHVAEVRQAIKVL
jgi:thioredoxin-dependent peroxiredoxin